jgi:hypothetical protein
MADVGSTGEGDSVGCMSGAKIRTGEEGNEVEGGAGQRERPMTP